MMLIISSWITQSIDVTVDYAFQDTNDIPGTLPEGRTKPWGTGRAVLAAKKVITRFMEADPIKKKCYT